jgi:hypothetical protein
MRSFRNPTQVSFSILVVVALCGAVSGAEPQHKFELGKAQYIKDKTEVSILLFIVPVRAQKAEYFKEPGLKIAYVLFKDAVKTPPTDLKGVEQNFDLSVDKDGNRELSWEVHSALQNVTGKSHLFMGAPQFKSVGRTGIMMFGLRSPAGTTIVEMDMGIYLLDNLEQGSNVLVYRPKDFVVGDPAAVFAATVAKLSAQPAK